MNLKLKERIERCERIQEGSEIGDVITSLCSAADAVERYCDDFKTSLIVTILEEVVSEYIDYLQSERGVDFEEYNRIDDETFFYFTNTKKMTEREFNGYWNGE